MSQCLLLHIPLLCSPPTYIHTYIVIHTLRTLLSNGESHVGAGINHLFCVSLKFRDIYESGTHVLGLLSIGNDWQMGMCDSAGCLHYHGFH